MDGMDACMEHMEYTDWQNGSRFASNGFSPPFRRAKKSVATRKESGCCSRLALWPTALANEQRLWGDFAPQQGRSATATQRRPGSGEKISRCVHALLHSVTLTNPLERGSGSGSGFWPPATQWDAKPDGDGTASHGMGSACPLLVPWGEILHMGP